MYLKKHGRIPCRSQGPKCRHLIYVSSIHYEEAFPRKRRQLLVLWVIIWQSFSLSLCQKPCRNQMRTLYALKVKNNPWQWATSLHSWIIFCSFWSELSNLSSMFQTSKIKVLLESWFCSVFQWFDYTIKSYRADWLVFGSFWKIFVNFGS